MTTQPAHGQLGRVLTLAGEVTCMLKTLIKRRLHLFLFCFTFVLLIIISDPCTYVILNGIVLMLVTDNIQLSYITYVICVCHGVQEFIYFTYIR